MEFDGRGFLAKPQTGDWQWGLQLTGYGLATSRSDAHTTTLPPAKQVRTDGNRSFWTRDALMEEWFINDQRGLEQGWTLHQKPKGTGDLLRLNLAVRGNLTAVIDGASAKSVTFVDHDAATVLTYGGLKAWDATGRDLAVSFSTVAGQPNHFSLEVEVAGAEWPVTIDPLAQRVILKGTNTEKFDQFGRSVAIAGETVVVGAPAEDSAATGVNGNATDNSADYSGAAYVFVRDNLGQWSQQAYLKASNTGAGDQFGCAVAISADTIVVGAVAEESSASGVGGNQNSNAFSFAGAAYVFVRDGTGAWSQQAYLKSSNTNQGYFFGTSVAVDGDTIVIGAPRERYSSITTGAAHVYVRDGLGTWSHQLRLSPQVLRRMNFGSSVAIHDHTIVVGAVAEPSNATTVNGDQSNSAAPNAGAAYVFLRDGGGNWSQQAYLKASNSGENHWFGTSVAIDTNRIVVGATGESSNASGVNGNQTDNSMESSGAAYVFSRAGGTWTQEAYLKASNPGPWDGFGSAVAIKGQLAVVSASAEASNAKGINGNQRSNSAEEAGAAYLFGLHATAGWRQQAYIKASNTKKNDYFGSSVALSSDTLLIGGGDSGYLFDLLKVDDFKSLAKNGQALPDVTDVHYNVFGAAYLNDAGAALFEASLAGKGTKGGKNRGLFSGGSGESQRILRLRDPLDAAGAAYQGLQVAKLSAPLLNQSDSGWFQLQLRGSGVNASNRQVLMHDNGTTFSPVLRAGDALTELSNAAVASFREVLQPPPSTTYSVVSYQLARSREPRVTAINDTGILLVNADGSVRTAAAREERTAFGPEAGEFGQFTGRAAVGSGNITHFGAGFKPAGANKAVQALFWMDPNGSSSGRTAVQGVEQPAIGSGISYRSFTALSASGAAALFKATLSGGGVKVANNEVILRDNEIWLRKGVTDLGDGLIARRILKFWPVADDRLLVQVQLGGSGVTARNNAALVLRNENGSWQTLCRSGEDLTNSPGVKIGKLQAVDVCSESGAYVILASLTGSPKNANQVLLLGDANQANAADRLPRQRLRKGGFYQTELTAADPIKSLSLKPVVDKSGAGGRGLGRVINSSMNTLITILADKKITELLRVSPGDL